MQLAPFEAVLAQWFGLAPRPGWSDRLRQAVERLCDEQGCDAAELLGRLRHEPRLTAELASHVTVAESHFLRHPQHFDLLPELVRSRLAELAIGERVRIWSAGCAKGEEPYSISIVLTESLGATDLDRIDIIANDLDGRVVEHARRGAYAAWSMRGTAARILARYFSVNGAGCLLADEVRQRVTFSRCSITEQLERLAAGSIDIIFFRNVAIYLERQALNAIYSGFARVLRPESGILLTAPGDPGPHTKSLVRHPSTAPGVYRRVEPSSDLPVSPARRQVKGRGRRRVDSNRRKSVTARSRRAVTRAKTPTRTSARLRAIDLADRGDVDRALELASQLISSKPDAAAGYVLRGQVLLAGQRVAEAVEDFRRAVYFDGGDRLARYWFAMALEASGLPRQAKSQFTELARRLAPLAADTILEDGDTTAAQLRAATAFRLNALG